ncbi:hypothetical protein F5Y17DRAFT_415447 [Xylariaceae sp. FL0594]|nr:hypothetical protein F5Y17DRAFT_415447 [Xylariaceae sp. FL0594]
MNFRVVGGFLLGIAGDVCKTCTVQLYSDTSHSRTLYCCTAAKGLVGWGLTPVYGKSIALDSRDRQGSAKRACYMRVP